jgi:hypothetical protein
MTSPHDCEPRSASPTLDQLTRLRWSRREVLVLSALGVAAWAGGRASGGERMPGTPPARPPLRALSPSRNDAFELAGGLTFDLVARWGDALFADAPSMDGRALLAGALLEPGAAGRQMRQFGTECDGTVFFPERGRSDRGVLCVNHEYVNPELVFPGRFRSPEDAARRKAWIERHPQTVAWMQAAHGVSLFHVARAATGWRVERGGPLTRRITSTTECEVSGPARGSRLLRTSADPDGTRVRGTFANCASGRTPWGSYLTTEENIDDYFGLARTWARGSDDATLVEAHRRFPLLEASLYGWEHVDRRFLVAREPREPLRFGWIVEIDPENPASRPRKRTALGRFSHENATTQLTRDGRVAVYMGDDDEFEYVYKFVTRERFDPRDRRANRDLLDHGVLHVARFDADGTGAWLPLVHDEKGPLGSKAGFSSQADVVVKARAAADLLGATPMDRPEDIEANPATGRVYIVCTKNPRRVANSRVEVKSGRPVDIGTDRANPRPENALGHIIELREREDDAGATTFSWDVFLLAGEGEAAHVSCPDNIGFDPAGRLWIVTDTDDRKRPNNGCFVVETEGPQRGRLLQVASSPVGAELCGCEFTPDGTTLFVGIQHPGEGGTIDAPISHWPDGGELPARASLVAIRREDGAPL